mmetsp:Transcript_39837/g.62336  ORF Transcript_39837/g.62336 Transcript_39837/m.62336 type:complete len:282 (+) Transcript_39837:50-895(+)
MEKDNADASTSSPRLLVPLLAGGFAGTSVDVALFPIDTIKTRLQSAQGFFKAGGFKGIYNGISAAAAGSAPGGAMFFMGYEYAKDLGENTVGGPDSIYAPLVHMTAASFGETVACLIRVPTENCKQKMQMGQFQSFKEAITTISRTKGVSGFFTGYLTTVMREVPFSFIQFPLYEAMKAAWARRLGREGVEAWQAACCGSAAGGVAAAVTTPLDVVKTRLMTATDPSPNAGMLGTMADIYRKEGMAKLFSGITPRVSFICIGGFVFFGAYETGKSVLTSLL